MSDTTIRLYSAMRDKLRALADRDTVTLGDLLGLLRRTGPGSRTPRYQAGDVLLVDLDPPFGHERGGRCPVLVLSGPSYNELWNEQLIVATITSRQRDLPFHVPVDADCGLRTPGWVQSESVRAISVHRVVRQFGRARPETVAEVRNRVIDFLRD